MSTRLYPLFVKGNPQLRIFLPNFWMKLVKPLHPVPPNEVHFMVPLQMTSHDIKSYLEKIYKIPVMKVTTKVWAGEIKKNEYFGHLRQEEDYRMAYVVLYCEN
ncbi:large ribosomal subunit protein uL23m isoform X2 [Centruroides vittatus]|uniref:large ribosomal subunit protein uL23m isoform X2 n=1 Tax=Centruroides vittatus TaxID=120091 RepID=UPI00350F6D42